MSAGYTATTEGSEALAAATAETVIQLRGATTTNARIRRWWVSFDGVTAAAVPVTVRLLRQTTDGTGSAATEVKLDPGSVAAACAALHSFSAEPTAGEVIESHFVKADGGGLVIEYPDIYEDSPILGAATTSRIGIEVTAAAVVNVLAGIQWLE